MNLETLRNSATAVLIELLDQAEAMKVKSAAKPSKGSDSEAILLAYCFRWLWEHATPTGPRGEMVNQKPLMAAFEDAAPKHIPTGEMEAYFKTLRMFISQRLDEAGLIERPYQRAWRWVLIANQSTLPSDDDLPELSELSGEEPSSVVPLAEAASKARTANGLMPHLGEQLTVIGMRLEHDGVRIEAVRDDGDTIIDLSIIEKQVSHGS